MTFLLLLFEKNKNVIVGQIVSRKKGQRDKLAGKIHVSVFSIINQGNKQAESATFSQARTNLYASQTTWQEGENLVSPWK